jgi:hypothetical protein
LPPDISGYEAGWEDLVGIDDSISISEGTYFHTPFFTLLIAKGGDTIVPDIPGRGTYYFDRLYPAEVAALEIGQMFAPDEPIVRFPAEFDRH